MIQVSIVTEGRSDAQLLKRLLPSELTAQAEFIIGGGSYGAQSLAGSILASQRHPVVLVVDADGWKDHVILQQIDFLNTLLWQAGGGIPFEVLVAKPEIEILYFYDRALFDRAAGIQMDDVTWTTAQYEPKKVLQHLMGEDYEQLYTKLDDEAVRVLREHPLITDLIRFPTQVVAQPT